MVSETINTKTAKGIEGNNCTIRLTSAVKNGEKHLVDYVRQPDGKRGQHGIRFILYARYIY